MEKIIFLGLVIPIFGFVLYLGATAIMNGFSAKSANKINENSDNEIIDPPLVDEDSLSHELEKLNKLSPFKKLAIPLMTAVLLVNAIGPDKSENEDQAIEILHKANPNISKIKVISAIKNNKKEDVRITYETDVSEDFLIQKVMDEEDFRPTLILILNNGALVTDLEFLNIVILRKNIQYQNQSITSLDLNMISYGINILLQN